MKDQYRKEISWWFAELGSESEVDNHLIAVGVIPGNKIASITSLWDTCAGDIGDFITQDELKSILSIENYNKLLCKPAENH